MRFDPPGDSRFSIFLSLLFLLLPLAAFGRQEAPPLGDVARDSRTNKPQQPKAKIVLTEEGRGITPASCEIAYREHGAFDDFQTLVYSVKEYEARHHKLAKDLTTLSGGGPGISMQDTGFLIPTDLASGDKGGYHFTYVPGGSQQDIGAGAAAGSQFTVEARPQTYGQTGQTSFYADNSNAAACTTENRSATRSDPPCHIPFPPDPATPGCESGGEWDEIHAIMNLPPGLTKADLPSCGPTAAEKKKCLDALAPPQYPKNEDLFETQIQCKDTKTPYTCLSREQRIRQVLFDQWQMTQGYEMTSGRGNQPAEATAWHQEGVDDVLNILRTLNTSEVTYMTSYGKGFSASLRELGPAPDQSHDANHADLILPKWVGDGSGFVAGSYQITYTAGRRQSSGLIESYILTARPLQYGGDTRRSFYTDEMGIIHETSEDRLATAQDPPIR